MSTCSQVTNQKQMDAFASAVKNTNTNFSILTKSCPMSNASTGGGRKLKGGAKLTSEHIKYIFLVVAAALSGFLMSGDSIAAKGVWDGVNGIFSGECANISNNVFSAFGIQNPICEGYILLITQINNAIRKDPVAIAFMYMFIKAVIGAPADANRIVNAGVAGFVSIVNQNYPGLIETPTQPPLLLGNGQDAPVEEVGEDQIGGKRRGRFSKKANKSSRGKTSKVARKSKKANKGKNRK
jgi:hypothetical protein